MKNVSAIFVFICVKLARLITFQVILGGGRQTLIDNTASNEPANPWGCNRRDGQNLFETYREDKIKRGLKHSIVTNNKELRDLDVDNTDYLLGNILH